MSMRLLVCLFVCLFASLLGFKFHFAILFIGPLFFTSLIFSDLDFLVLRAANTSSDDLPLWGMH